MSTFYLPAMGGLEKSMQRIISALFKAGIVEIEVICAPTPNIGKLETAKIDKTLPYRVNRIFISNKLFSLSKNYNTIVGGKEKLNLKGKISMVLFGLNCAIFLFIKAFILALSNRKRKIIFHTYGISSLIVAVLIKKIFANLFLSKNIKIFFTNGFIYSKSGFKFVDNIISYCIRSADEIFCNTQKGADRLSEDFNLNSQNIYTYNNWIDLSNFYRKHKRKSNVKAMLFVGRIIPEKGIIELIELAKYIDKNNLSQKYKITIIGNSEHPIKSTVIEMSKNIHCLEFIGHVPHDQLPRYFEESDVLLFPSKWEEAAGNVAIEAGAMGTPVITTLLGPLLTVRQFPIYRIVDSFMPINVLTATDQVIEEKEKIGNEEYYKISHEIALNKFSENNFKVYSDNYKRIACHNDKQ